MSETGREERGWLRSSSSSLLAEHSITGTPGRVASDRMALAGKTGREIGRYAGPGMAGWDRGGWGGVRRWWGGGEGHGGGPGQRGAGGGGAGQAWPRGGQSKKGGKREKADLSNRLKVARERGLTLVTALRRCTFPPPIHPPPRVLETHSTAGVFLDPALRIMDPAVYPALRIMDPAMCHGSSSVCNGSSCV